MQADKAAVARTLVQLEMQGYVERRSDPHDGRVTRVYLTDKSRKMQAKLEAAVERVLNRLNLDRSEEELHKLQGELSTMLNSLDEHYQVSSGTQTKQ